MQRGGQSATANHESFGVRVETDAARAWLEINLFGPSAAQSIFESVGDSVNFSLRTTSCGFRHETIPTGVARAMHIEKGNAVAFAKFAAFDIEHCATNLTRSEERRVGKACGCLVSE